MQNDEIIWQIINKHFCAFKYTTLKEDFCKNDKNVTGLCNRSSCPLANSNYGTVMEHQGMCYLYLKTVERAQTPINMWEKIKLSKNYTEALEQIDTNMKNVYSELQIHRCKQRFTRLRQKLIRMRRMALKPQLELVPIKKKTERREAAREKRAEIVANLDSTIEGELLDRLHKGTYGNLYKLPQSAEMETHTEMEDLQEARAMDDTEFDNLELIDEEESDFEEEMEEEDESLENAEDLDLSDSDEDESTSYGKRYFHPSQYSSIWAKKRPRVEIEYEQESSTNPQSM